MKYIDADRLKKAIEDKGLDCSFALKMERLDTLALIDELQQEQPQVADASKMVQPVEGLEELRKEVIKFSQDHFDELHSDMETIDIVHIIACHFAEWGAAHARKEDK